MASGGRLLGLDFEIFGRVQGVFFRKHTQKTAEKLQLVGWVMNTRQNTVQGQVQGPAEKITEMRQWLTKKGSPKSRIDKAVFTNQQDLEKLSFTNFNIRH